MNLAWLREAHPDAPRVLLIDEARESHALLERVATRVGASVHHARSVQSGLRHALEVRHESFATPELIDLLREHDVALVVADTAGRWPFLTDLTADFVYVRLHGDVELYKSGYTDEALERWAARVRAWRDGRKPPAATFVAPAPRLRPRDVYVYFDNDVKVHAPYDAMNLAAKVEGTSHEESRLESKAQPRPLPRQTRLRANA